MSKKLVWDQAGEKFYETGVEKGVLYPVDATGAYPKGVAWNGLTKVTESPSGAEPTDLYANNKKYLSLLSAETFGATVECYTYPDEFAACNGEQEIVKGITFGQQTRTPFGLSYQTKEGNDLKGNDLGYKIHIVYGCVAKPSQRDYSTINDSPEAITFSYEISTTPVEVEGFKPTATVVIDSIKVEKSKLTELENILYGSEEKEAYLPTLAELVSLVGNTSVQG